MILVLDLCYNHNGDLDIARRMIDELADLKKDYPEIHAVKFQKWNVHGMSQEVRNKVRDPKTSFGSTYFEHRLALEFTVKQLISLREHTRRAGLKFGMSGHDLASYEDILTIRPDFIKIPSQFLLREDIFKIVRSAKIPIHASHGMHDRAESLKSRYWMTASVNYYCVSLYPPELEQICLDELRTRPFNGYSSHELDGEAVPLAVAFGAKWIERHYTFDQNAKGSDHKISSTASGIRTMIDNTRRLSCMIGKTGRPLTKEERDAKLFYGSF